MSTAAAAPTPAEAPSPPEPIVRGESLYDRVTSFLMAVVVGAFLVVGWLALVYATNQAARRGRRRRGGAHGFAPTARRSARAPRG